MSRNLRGGANKGFNFALGADNSSDSEQEEEEIKVFVAPAPSRPKGKPSLGLFVEPVGAVPIKSRQK
jgi:hypothetical protein